MRITADEVRHVALLARLALTPEEEAGLAATLDDILTYIAKLEELDTSNVEPTAHVHDVASPWREDRVVNAPEVEALLANAPDRDDDLFRVPKIIE